MYYLTVIDCLDKWLSIFPKWSFRVRISGLSFLLLGFMLERHLVPTLFLFPRPYLNPPSTPFYPPSLLLLLLLILPQKVHLPSLVSCRWLTIVPPFSLPLPSLPQYSTPHMNCPHLSLSRCWQSLYHPLAAGRCTVVLYKKWQEKGLFCTGERLIWQR